MAGVKQYAWSYERGPALARRDSRGVTRDSRPARQVPEIDAEKRLPRLAALMPTACC
jgi:hypothetical protein